MVELGAIFEDYIKFLYRQLFGPGESSMLRLGKS
jgi:hypothetical protein